MDALLQGIPDIPLDKLESILADLTERGIIPKKSKFFRGRITEIRITGKHPLRVNEVHLTSCDRGNWLDAAIDHIYQFAGPNQSRLADSFAKSSQCGIHKCESVVRAGAHMTLDGEGLIIVPVCSVHNFHGNVDRLPEENRTLKAYQCYAMASFKKGTHILHENNKYFLAGSDVGEKEADEEVGDEEVEEEVGDEEVNEEEEEE